MLEQFGEVTAEKPSGDWRLRRGLPRLPILLRPRPFERRLAQLAGGREAAIGELGAKPRLYPGSALDLEARERPS
jgi:hypothetical protein